jgi:hypothetical protein
VQLLLCLIFFYLSIFIHEVGHLFAAWLVGWKPLDLTVGRDKSRTLFRIGDLRIHFRIPAVGGRARAVALSPNYFRLKQLIFIAGGPGISIAVGLLLWGLVSNELWMSRLSDWWGEMAMYFLFVAAVFVWLSLVPWTHVSGGKVVSSDMWMIFKTLSMRKSAVQSHYLSHVFCLSEFLLEDHRIDEARANLLKAAEAHGSAVDARIFWIHALLQVGRKSEAQAEIDMLSKEGVPSECRAKVLDGIACLPIFWGHLELAEESMRYIDEAIAEEPETITLKGTKGSLLVEVGRLDEGIQMLEAVRNGSDVLIDKATSEYYLALAFFKKGDQQQARSYLKSAVAIDPVSRVRPRVAGEILGAKWASVKADDL